MNFYEQLFCRGRTTGEGMTHFERLFAAKFGGSPPPKVREYTGAVPVTITADGTPLLDYLISGNTTQSGTPTPDNPIMPQGTGERTGNLAKYWKPAYVTADGSVNANRVNGVSFPVKLEAGQTISFTNQKANFGRGIAVFSGFDGEILTDMIYRSTNNNVTYTADSDCYVVIWGNYDNTTSMDETMFNLCGQMLNLGSTALPYEPYGIKIPMSSAGQTNNIYLGEVQTTRKIKKLVLTGNEIILRDREREGSWRFFTDRLISAKDSTGICSHFENIGTNDVNNSDNIGFSIFNNAQFGCRCPKSIADTATDFRSYLAAQYAAGTPVTVWYVLATSETGIVNEPLMKIGDYADTVSKAQAGVAIPTNNGSTTVDVDTTLKPSEIYIKYMG